MTRVGYETWYPFLQRGLPSGVRLQINLDGEEIVGRITDGAVAAIAIPGLLLARRLAADSAPSHF